MQKELSKYKVKRIAVAALENALRLHLDSILLYEYGSYPSAFQMSVQALEEFIKARYVDQYYLSVTNAGLPDSNFEESWLRLLYLHGCHPTPVIGRGKETFDYPAGAEDRKLELQRRRATYVGLSGGKKESRKNSRISVPTRIKEKDARQIISAVNRKISDVYSLVKNGESCWGIEELNHVINPDEHLLVFCWPHKEGKKKRGRPMKI